jgi:hypothetical protein
MFVSDHPLYNYPFALKVRLCIGESRSFYQRVLGWACAPLPQNDVAFFSGSMNWGDSKKFFTVNGKQVELHGRQYLSQLSLSHPDKVVAFRPTMSCSL